MRVGVEPPLRLAHDVYGGRALTAVPLHTVDEVMVALQGDFSEFAKAFSRGEYLLWLGSGISRDVVPDIKSVLRQLLDELHSRIDGTDPNCRYRRAIDEVLDVAEVPDSVRRTVNLVEPVDNWPHLNDILSRLQDRYSDVLDVQVDGESEDFLVWDGIKVPYTYGASTLEPDVQHFCIAILMLEGIVVSAPTTNWDGLVEAAMKLLTGYADMYLKVVVAPADFAGPNRQAELIKFHGCAVRAAHDPATYRTLLIARKSQVSGWTSQPRNQMMKNHLEHLLAAHPAFMVGLSAQDANIHIVLHEARQNLSRFWPVSPPAVVFAEQELHRHHRHVLQVTYGTSHAANVDAIRRSALLGAYSKPALLSLLIFTLSEKLSVLIGCVSDLRISEKDVQRLRGDIRSLREAAAREAQRDSKQFIERLRVNMAHLLTTFRTGGPLAGGGLNYQPISVAPIARSLNNPDFPSDAFGRLAVAVSLFGRGLSEGLWTLAGGDPRNPSEGVLRMVSKRGRTKLFLVKDSRVLSELELAGVYDADDDSVLVIRAEALGRRTARSPRSRYGRTGASGARSVDLEELCTTAGSAEELFENFRLEGAI